MYIYRLNYTNSFVLFCILVAYIRKKIAIKKRLTGVNLALSLIIQPMERQSDNVNKKEPNKKSSRNKIFFNISMFIQVRLDRT